MNSQEFFNNLVNLYQHARIPCFASLAIKRDRCRSVSGALEDLLAYMIVQNHDGKYLAYVDQYLNLGKKPVMYVDVLLYNQTNRKVEHFIDAKTDLGWSSTGLEALCRRFKQQVERAKQVRVKLVDQTGVERYLPVSSDAQCHVVIATRVNGRGLTAERIDRIQRDLGVNVFVLSDGLHPNSFSRQVGANYPANLIAESEFERLHAALR